MRPIVDEDLCSGCEVCVDTCPEVFEMGDDGLSHVIEADSYEDQRDCIVEAVESCPDEAISIEE